MHKIVKYKSVDLLAIAAADFFVKLAASSIKKNGKFMVALSGGSTPNSMYALLAEDAYSKKVDWKNVCIFWGDERCVPMNSNQNNSYQAKKILLNNIPIPKENIFPIPVKLAPAEAAAHYEETIKQFFKTDLPKFDLIFLGMGDNGHTASLFPHTSILAEKKAIVKEVYVEEIKMDRISFTAPLINNASNILFLVAGKEKTSMLQKVLKGPYLPKEYPAQLIKNARWFVCE
jgi:6-phosphogluconolactonase